MTQPFELTRERAFATVGSRGAPRVALQVCLTQRPGEFLLTIFASNLVIYFP